MLAFISLIAVDASMVVVHAGKYHVGKATFIENPPRTVALHAFSIAKTETTNAEFAAFVKATGYLTDAERRHDAMKFRPPLAEFRWLKDPSASWRFPNGSKDGDIHAKSDHPVTTISYADAERYCNWAHVRLPTLDEWEVACRAGTSGDYFFGPDVNQIGKYANIWHGKNHLVSDTSDGYVTTSPVAKFLPNPWGLYDVYGNVFEFCSGHLPTDGPKTRHARGGSWWCSANACCFFNSADIGKVNLHASFSNQGFRVVRDAH